MGHSRTLIRKSISDRARRAKPENRRKEPGSFERRVVTLSKFGAKVEVTFHATKGPRQRRVA